MRLWLRGRNWLSSRITTFHIYLAMEKNELWEMTDEALLVEKKKLRNTKILHATIIGFLAGVVIFGVAAWSLSEDKQIGFLIPMLIPIAMIYRQLKKPKQNQELEEVLKARGLD